MTGEQRLRAVWLVLFLGGCFTLALALSTITGQDLVPGAEPYKVQVVMPNSFLLTTNSNVREAGVRIGHVNRLLTPGASSGHLPTGGVTVAKLELDDPHTPIYRDASALVRSKSIAQEAYVELNFGHPSAGPMPSNGVIPANRVQEATQFDEITSVFDAARRKDLKHVLDGLGGGLEGHGRDLNRVLESSNALTQQGVPVAGLLNRERGHVAGLIDSFGRVTGALGDRKEAIRVLTRGARREAEAVAGRDDKLRAFLDELPPLLRQGRGTANRLTTFSRDATPVLGNLRLASEDLVPAVSDLRPAAVAGRRTVRNLDRFARVAQPTIRQLRPFAGRTSTTLVPALAAFLRDYNPLAAYLAPYRRELSTFFANSAGWTSLRDNIGNTLRIISPLSQSNFPGIVTADQEEAYQRLVKKAGLDTRERNAYPAPGTAGDPVPFTGAYPRLQRDPPIPRSR